MIVDSQTRWPSLHFFQIILNQCFVIPQ